jgi:hypothetical protein
MFNKRLNDLLHSTLIYNMLDIYRIRKHIYDGSERANRKRFADYIFNVHKEMIRICK